MLADLRTARYATDINAPNGLRSIRHIHFFNFTSHSSHNEATALLGRGSQLKFLLMTPSLRVPLRSGSPPEVFRCYSAQMSFMKLFVLTELTFW